MCEHIFFPTNLQDSSITAHFYKTVKHLILIHVLEIHKSIVFLVIHTTSTEMGFIYCTSFSAIPFHGIIYYFLIFQTEENLHFYL